MAEQKLITKSDISEFFEIGKNLDNSRIEAAVMLAQQNDLEPILGGALYRDLCEDPDGVNNALLLQGEDYELNGATIYYRGVRAQLSCYAYARLIRKPSNMVTRSGVKQKENVNSLPVDTTVENQMIRDAYSRAKKFEKDTIQYLDEHLTEYPLYNQSQGKQFPRKKTFRISRL